MAGWFTLRNHHRNNFFLPEDLLIAILLRLPVESLLRFKTVCTHWFDVINGSDFLDKHFDNHTNHSRLLVYHDITYPINSSGQRGEAEVLSIFPDETLAGERPSHRRLDFLDMAVDLEEIIGPVKGVFLVCHDGDELGKGYTAALLNPATREYRPLCVPYSDWNSSTRWFYQMLGFGIDPLTSDFKVVSLWCWDESYSSIPPSGRPRAVVYSLASNSWKFLDLDLDHDPLHKMNRRKIFHSGTVCLNGNCYWMLKDHRNFYLLSFNLTTDVLREIKGPECNILIKHPKLVLYNDCVAMFCYYPWRKECMQCPDYIELMVMKQEGCWTKDLRVHVSHLRTEWSPLGFWKNNSIIMHVGHDMQLVLYDLSSNKIKQLGIHKHCRGSRDASPFVYKASLVSLKGGNVPHDSPRV